MAAVMALIDASKRLRLDADVDALEVDSDRDMGRRAAR